MPVTQRLVAEYGRHAQEPAVVPDPGTIADREREIVALVAQGLDNDEIARCSPTPAT